MSAFKVLGFGTALVVVMIINAINSAPQFPDWAGQWDALQNQTGVTGIPGAPAIPAAPAIPSFGGESGGFPGIGSFGDLQNQTLPGGNIGTGFFDQLQNQTIPTDIGQIQGALPGAGGNTGGSE